MTIDYKSLKIDYKLLKFAEDGDIEAMKNLAEHFDKLAKHEPEVMVGETISIEEFNKRLRKGDGKPDYLAEAYKWWLKAAEAGDVESMLKVSGRLYDGIGVDKDEKTSFEWDMKAAELGNVRAMRLVAHKYWMGLGVESSKEKKYEWYLKAAEKGDEDAIQEVAVMVGVGEGTAKDDKKAAEWIQKLSRKAAAEAMYNIGVRTDSMEWLKKVANISKENNVRKSRISAMAFVRMAEEAIANEDFIKAMEYYQNSADLGNVEALSVIGDFYYIGEGEIPQSYEKAFEYYSEAAALDYNMAAVKLARMYYYGLGTEQNVEKAFEIFYTVANRSEKFVYRFNSVAKYFLAKMYENGEGVEKDLNEAYKWYLMAAAFKNRPREGSHNVSPAMYKAAEMTLLGIGCNQNSDKALEYYKSTYDGAIGVTHYRYDAATKVEFMYKLGESIPKDEAKVESWKEELAEERRKRFEEAQKIR